MKYRKALLTLAIAVALMGAFTLGTKAADTLEAISAYLNYGITVKYNGETQSMTDANGAPVYPITYNDTTYLPVRAISNMLGVSVDWDPDTQTVLLGGAENDAVKYASVQEFLDENKEEIDGVIAAMIEDAGGTGELDITARGNSMVYRFQYTIDISGIVNAKFILDDGLENRASDFEHIYTELKKVVPSAESVIVEVYDMKGRLITSREFKADDVVQYASVQEYLDAYKEELDAAIASADEDGSMELDITARGNSLVYSYRYTIDIGSTANAKEILDMGLEDQAFAFESTYDGLKEEVPSVESIIVEYYDMNGKLITSREYK